MLYQFLFNLVIPVYKTTRKIKKGFREMHGHMQEQQKQQAGNSPQASPSKPAPKAKAGDYIDFEEIRF
jgi:hypothetical protein